MRLTRAQVAQFRDLDRAAQLELLSKMTPADMLEFDALFEIWAHAGQLPPDGEGWRLWLMMAGRGFGKTRAGAEWVLTLARSAPMRIALVGATIDEARRVMVEGNSGLLTLAKKRRIALDFEPSQGRLTFRNGSIAQLFSGDNPDGLRGPEHHIAWCDELAKWRRAEDAWDNLNMGLRLGRRPRALVTTTPRPGPLLEKLRAMNGTAEGECHIVGTAPSGAWAGQAKALAGYTGGGWRFIAPPAGMRAVNLANGSIVRFVGGQWVAAPAAIPDATAGQEVATINAILAALRSHGLIAS